MIPQITHLSSRIARGVEKSQGQRGIGTNQSSGKDKASRWAKRSFWATTRQWGRLALGNEATSAPATPQNRLARQFPIFRGGRHWHSPGFAAKYLHLAGRRHSAGSFTFCQFSSGWGPLPADPIILFVPNRPTPTCFRSTQFDPLCFQFSLTESLIWMCTLSSKAQLPDSNSFHLRQITSLGVYFGSVLIFPTSSWPLISYIWSFLELPFCSPLLDWF